jgi:hypothetical protein
MAAKKNISSFDLSSGCQLCSLAHGLLQRDAVAPGLVLNVIVSRTEGDGEGGVGALHVFFKIKAKIFPKSNSDFLHSTSHSPQEYVSWPP